MKSDTVAIDTSNFVVNEYKVPTVVVIFGASGDLTHRKLLPAFANLVKDGYLGKKFWIIGASRTFYSDQTFREYLNESIDAQHRDRFSSEEWQDFEENIFYQPLDALRPEDFTALKKRIEELREHDNSKNSEFNVIYYLSTSPRFFTPIADNLAKSGLVERDPESKLKTRLVVEKPFGHDKESAHVLNESLRSCFSENQIFRIDHYLGKETVQNILVMRFCNYIFEPLWNARYIEQIQLSVCEDIGVGSRAGYFDRTGITRDVVQNHVLQMLSLLCIEPPISLSNPDYIRDEKVKVLRAIRRYRADQALHTSIRGQYSDGEINGKHVKGYLHEEGIESGSSTETYVAMKLEINNWRWAGVPVYIRAGKRLPRRITEISVWFKNVPDALFDGKNRFKLAQNVLSIQVQPREGISLSMNSKLPGVSMQVKPVELDFSYDHSFAARSPEAYERLLLDAIKGDSTLFTRDDEIEEAWDVLAPFFEAWDIHRDRFSLYPAGTWGPTETTNLLSRGGNRWKDLS
jgi:glucose-6-phosphate 1-dehydrogenase